jgi:hypothetical protein
MSSRGINNCEWYLGATYMLPRRLIIDTWLPAPRLMRCRVCMGGENTTVRVKGLDMPWKVVQMPRGMFGMCWILVSSGEQS